MRYSPRRRDARARAPDGPLLDLLPQRVVAQFCDFSEIEWDRVPAARRRSILTKHLCSYSPGTLSPCQRALILLGRWLESNGFSDLRVSWECSGGLLSWFVQDDAACGGSHTAAVVSDDDVETKLAPRLLHPRAVMTTSMTFAVHRGASLGGTRPRNAETQGANGKDTRGVLAGPQRGRPAKFLPLAH